MNHCYSIMPKNKEQLIMYFSECRNRYIDSFSKPYTLNLKNLNLDLEHFAHVLALTTVVPKFIDSREGDSSKCEVDKVQIEIYLETVFRHISKFDESPEINYEDKFVKFANYFIKMVRIRLAGYSLI